MSPIDHTVLKQKIKDSRILSEKEKNEWIYLLPKMNEEQIKELEQILALHITLPSTPSSSPPGIFTKILHKPSSASSISVIPDLVRNPENKELDSRLRGNDNSLDYLRSLSLETLRADGTTHSFFLDLKKKIANLRQTIPGTEIKKAFEESPLWKTYMQAGMTAMEGGTQNLMSTAEFEMVADFRSELRKLLS